MNNINNFILGCEGIFAAVRGKFAFLITRSAKLPNIVYNWLCLWGLLASCRRLVSLYFFVFSIWNKML